MRLCLTNIGDSAVDLYLRGRTIAFDIEVRAANGAVVWRRLAGAIIPAILRVQRLAPGESLELGDVWDQRSSGSGAVPPGRYAVRAELLTDEPAPIVFGPAPLDILPP